MNLDNKISHPSYGLINASRITGRFNYLYGSKVKNDSAVKITISRAATVRDVFAERFWEESRLIDIYLSPSQWAQMLTTMNTAPGTPCTINWLFSDGYIKPPAVEPDANVTQADEMRAHTAKLVGDLNDKLSAVKKILDDKKSLSQSDRRDILGILDSGISQLNGALPFAVEQFGKVCEKMVTQAKADIEAFRTITFAQLGQSALENISKQSAEKRLTFEEDRPGG